LPDPSEALKGRAIQARHLKAIQMDIAVNRISEDLGGSKDGGW
jgi:hypothetical protein